MADDPCRVHKIMDFVKLLLVITLASIIPGQLVRIPIGTSAAITVSDLSVLTLIVVFFVYSLAIKKTLKFENQIFLPLLIFTLIAVSSTILAGGNFTISEIIIALLFQIRFLLYFLISQVIFNVVKKAQIAKWLKLILAVSSVFALIGFAQLLFFSDLSFLTSYGWDPHQKRIVSTFLDPNFAGGLLIISFALAISSYVYNRGNLYLILSLAIFVSIILTFSRSTYLATLVVILTIGFLKSPKILAGFLTIFIFSFLIIPQVRERIAGAWSVDETSKARIESWRRAVIITKDHPFFGVGFNTYRAAQRQYGFFSPDLPEGGHSGAGSDSSVLLVLVTTGVFGLLAYLSILAAILKKFSANAKSNPLGLGGTASFLGLLVHSQFVNSLFFPQIMILFWFIVGLNLADDT